MNIRRLQMVTLCSLCLTMGVCASVSEPNAQNNAELLKQFETFLKNKDSSETPEKAHKEIVKDKNFQLIEKFRDDLRKIFDSRGEILAKRPADFKLAIGYIERSLGQQQDKENFDPLRNSVSKISDQYDKIMPKIQGLLILLRCLDVIASNTCGIIEPLQQRDSTKPLTQHDAEFLWNNFEPAVKYSPDELINLTKLLFIDASKSKFEGKPNIPSYYFFHLMSNIFERLKEFSETLGQASFFRAFEDASHSIEGVLSNLDHVAKSDQTAKNILPFLEESRKSNFALRDFVKKREKEWKEYITTLLTTAGEVLNTIKGVMAAEKDQAIFNYVDQKSEDKSDQK